MPGFFFWAVGDMTGYSFILLSSECALAAGAAWMFEAGIEGLQLVRRGATLSNTQLFGISILMLGNSVSKRPDFSQIVDMMDRAFLDHPDTKGLILHSDQGWQYQHKLYQRMLEAKGIRQSMSRKGNCLDNAVMENFFGLLKTELLYLQDFDSIEHFKAELIDYLDYYNNRRIKLKLKGLTPAQHRYQTLQVA